MTSSWGSTVCNSRASNSTNNLSLSLRTGITTLIELLTIALLVIQTSQLLQRSGLSFNRHIKVALPTNWHSTILVDSNHNSTITWSVKLNYFMNVYSRNTPLGPRDIVNYCQNCPRQYRYNFLKTYRNLTCNPSGSKQPFYTFTYRREIQQLNWNNVFIKSR